MPKEPHSALNIRGVSKTLLWKWRERAASRKKTLKQFVLEALRDAMNKKDETKPPTDDR